MSVLHDRLACPDCRKRRSEELDGEGPCDLHELPHIKAMRGKKEEADMSP